MFDSVLEFVELDSQKYLLHYKTFANWACSRGPKTSILAPTSFYLAPITRNKNNNSFSSFHHSVSQHMSLFFGSAQKLLNTISEWNSFICNFMPCQVTARFPSSSMQQSHAFRKDHTLQSSSLVLSLKSLPYNGLHQITISCCLWRVKNQIGNWISWKGWVWRRSENVKFMASFCKGQGVQSRHAILLLQ